MGFADYESAFLAGSRLSELPLSILALSTELAYVVTFSYKAFCIKTQSYTQTDSIDLRFPFSHTNSLFPQDLCQPNTTQKVEFEFNKEHSPEAIAFLVISALAAVHCLVTLIIFALYWFNLLSARHRRTLFSVDFIIALILTLAWLASSIAWMIGSVQFVNEIDEDSIRHKANALKPCDMTCSTSGSSCCSLTYSNSLSIIYASPIAGLITFIVCLVELPFLFRKTGFYNRIQANRDEVRHDRFRDPYPVWTISKGTKSYNR